MVHQPYGHGNLVFALPELGLVIKTSTIQGAFNHTARNVRILRELDVPAPTVVAQGQDGDHTVLALKWIPGKDLGLKMSRMTSAQMRALARQIDAIQRRVAALPVGTGFGWAPIGASGAFPTWRAVVERDLAGLPETFCKMLAPYFEPWWRTLEACPATAYLDDLTVKNVIVEEGRLQGVVDLEFICYGDPLYWVALTEATVMLDVGDEGEVYGLTLRELRPSSPILDLYEALFAASFLGRDLSADTRRRIEQFFRERLSRALL